MKSIILMLLLTSSLVHGGLITATNTNNGTTMFSANIGGDGNGFTNLNATTITGTIPVTNLPTIIVPLFGGVSTSAQLPNGPASFPLYGGPLSTAAISEKLEGIISVSGIVTNITVHFGLNSGSWIGSGTNIVFTFFTNMTSITPASVGPIATLTGSAVVTNYYMFTTTQSFPVQQGLLIAPVVTNTASSGTMPTVVVSWSANIIKTIQ